MTLVAGLDLGQAGDPTALAILEQTSQLAPDTNRAQHHYATRYLQRWPLGTSYPAVVAEVLARITRPPLAMAPLVVDGTGVGRAVVDLLRGLGPRVVPVTIHGGQQTTRDADTGYWQVPKRELVGTIQVLLQSRRLRIAPDLADAAALVQELRAFPAHITPAGHDSYAAGVTPDDWRTGGAHDDLVLALALACWYLERVPRPRAFSAAVGAERRFASGSSRAGGVDEWQVQEQQQRAEWRLSCALRVWPAGIRADLKCRRNW